MYFSSLTLAKGMSSAWAISGTVQPRVQSSTIRFLSRRQDGASGRFEHFAEFATLAILAILIGAGGELLVERLEAAGALDALANHVDRANQFATFKGVVGEDQIEVQLAGAGLGQELTTNFLGAIVPKAGIEPGVFPADGAVALNAPHQVRFAGLRRQGRQADDERHRRGRQTTARCFQIILSVRLAHAATLVPPWTRQES